MTKVSPKSLWWRRSGPRAGIVTSALLVGVFIYASSGHEAPAPDPITVYLERVTAPAISSWAATTNQVLEVGPLLPVAAGHTFCMVSQYSSIANDLDKQGFKSLQLQEGAQDYVPENRAALVVINGVKGHSVQIETGSKIVGSLELLQSCACSRTARLERRQKMISDHSFSRVPYPINLRGDVSCRQ